MSDSPADKGLIIIQGSPRRGGNTEEAVRRLVAGLGTTLRVRVVNLYDLHIRRCEGCRTCMRDGICAIADDDFPALWKDIRASAVIVQACPVYWYAPPGIMKDFIDRTHSTYPDKSTLAGKSAYLLTVAADSGFEECETVLASWIRSYGGEVLATSRLLARDLGEIEARAENVARLAELAHRITVAGA